mgnify:CR=1 FL=1
MRMLIAPGASGTADSMQGHVDGLAARGIAATAIDLPRGKAERAMPAYRQATEAQTEGPAQLVIGGQSFGGRVASLLAADDRRTCGRSCIGSSRAVRRRR